LKDIPSAELATRVTAEAVRRASVAPAEIGHVVFGQVVQTEPRDMYVSRVAAVDAGIPVETPALTVNRLCGSGLQAIVSAAQSIKLGDCDIAVAGGVESKVKNRKGTAVFDTDEHVRHDATADDFKGLRPVFKRDGGSVTAGNASGINDGAAAVVLASEAAVGRLGLKPMARLIAYAHAGVEPLYMGLGPIPATRLAVKKAALDVADMDVIESNEAFAAQACAVSRELGFDAAKVNPNGSGISLGHPVGATGAINTVKAVYELARTGKRHALVTMCIGGGQGIAAIFERA
jgi:acetyl-CoA acetyltransferase